MTVSDTKKSTKSWMFVAFGVLVFVYLTRSILLPFVVGMLTAYFLDPAADRLERWKLSRGTATAIITISFFTLIALVGTLVVPMMIHQLSDFITDVPGYVQSLETLYEADFKSLRLRLGSEQLEAIHQATGNISALAVRMIGDFMTNLLQSGAALLNLISLVLITPLVAFYLLRDWDHIVARINKLLPQPHAETIREQMRLIDATVAGFIRGQMNVCLIMALYYAIGLSITGLNFGMMIGLCAGLLVIIPYIGAFLSMAVALVVACFQFDDMTSVGSVVLVFIIGQIIEGYFLTPKLVGNRVGLHPVWVIFGLLAGGALFGFLGVLIAVPVTAIIGVLIRFALTQYLKSPLYSGGK